MFLSSTPSCIELFLSFIYDITFKQNNITNKLIWLVVERNKLIEYNYTFDINFTSIIRINREKEKRKGMDGK